MKSRLNISAAGIRKRSKSLSDIENVSLLDFKYRNGVDEEDYKRLLSDTLYKIKTGDLEAVQRYAADGFDMRYCDYDKRTPLHIAAAEGKADIVNYLLDCCNVHPNALDRWNFTPYDEARRFNHADIVKRLEEIICTPDIAQQELHAIDEYDGKVQKKSAQAVEEETTIRLLYRVKEGNLAAVKIFHKAGIDMCARDYDDRTALHIAAAEGHETVVRFLVEQCDADPNSKDRWGQRPVDEARRVKHTTIVTLLEGYTAGTEMTDTSDVYEPQEYHDQDQTDAATELTRLDSSTTKLYTRALESGSEASCFTRVSIVGPPNVGKTSLARNLQDQSLLGLHSTDGINVCKIAYSQDLNVTKNPVGTREGAERIYNAHSRQQTDHSIGLNTSLNEENAGSESDVETLHEQTYLDPTQYEKVKLNLLHEDQESCDLENNSLEPNSLNWSTESMRSSDLQEETYPKEIPHLTRNCSDSAMNELMNFQDVLRSSNPPCKTNTINIWDYGGQCEYYSIHELFHSERAVYIFVFDISKELSDVIQDQHSIEQKSHGDPIDTLSYCKYWIHSLHMFAGCKKGYPKVILVGTHKDELTGCEDNKHKQIEERFEQIRQLFDGSEAQCHIDSEDFVIDNNNPNREDIHKLKERIQYLEKGYEVLEMPLKWVPLEIALRKLPNKWVTLNEIVDIDMESKVPINNTDEIRAFLKVHHILGNLVYFDEEELSDFVILDPQWIIDAFTSLVTAEMRYRKIPELRSALKSLREDAVLQDDLIQIVWKDKDNRFLDYKDMLLKVLIELRVLVKPLRVEVDSCKAKEERNFIVPSLLPGGPRYKTAADSLLRSELKTVTLSFMFSNSYISRTIFYRILAALIGELPLFQYRGQRVMCADIGIFKLDNDHAGIVEHVDSNIEITVTNMSEKNFNTQNAIKLRKQVETVINHGMPHSNNEQIYSCISDRYKLAMKCPKGPHYVYLDDLQYQENTRCLYSSDTLWHDINIVNKQWFQPIHVSVTDKDIQSIAKVIGKEWECVAIGLDITEEDVSAIKKQTDNAIVRNYKVLKRWLARENGKATWNVMFKIFSECGVDTELIHRVHSGISC